MHDDLWKYLIGSIVAVVLGWLQMRTKNAIQKCGSQVAEEAKEVKSDLQDHRATVSAKLSNITHLAEKSSQLLNGGALAKAKALAVTTRRLAELTKDPADVQAAEDAYRAYQECLEACKAGGSEGESI